MGGWMAGSIENKTYLSVSWAEIGIENRAWQYLNNYWTKLSFLVLIMLALYE